MDYILAYQLASKSNTADKELVIEEIYKSIAAPFLKTEMKDCISKLSVKSLPELIEEGMKKMNFSAGSNVENKQSEKEEEVKVEEEEAESDLDLFGDF